MSTWNFQTLYQEIQNEVEDTENDSLTVIKQLVNDVCQMIWLAEQWRFREVTAYISTAAGTRTYNLTTLLGYRLLQLTFAGYFGSGETIYREIDEADDDAFNTIYNDTTTQGRPFVFKFDGVTLTIHATPDYTGTNNLKIIGERAFVELTDDADVPLIPVEHKWVIKEGVKWLYYHFDDDVRETLDQQTFWTLGLAQIRRTELDTTTKSNQGSITPHRPRN